MGKLESKAGAEIFLPAESSIRELRAAAATCKGCELWRNATQTVFGAGSEHAKMMLIGEQPGDQEDLTGISFSGPAGHLLDRGLVDAGIDRGEVVTVHPSSILRMEDSDTRQVAMRHFIEDLRSARRAL
jgi:uracil-DNA glycosylase